MKAAFYTLGCKVNQYDTDGMMIAFEQSGYQTVPFSSVSDIYIVNSCSVTSTSEKKTRQIISRAHKTNPNAVIAVCGCYAVRSAAELLRLPGVRIAAGTKDRMAIVAMANQILSGEKQQIISTGADQSFEEFSAITNNKTRAQLKIQDGCDNFCAYCIIPHVRGGACSRSLASIASEAGKLVELGFSEIVITGINLSSYGSDNGSKLLEAIDTVARTGARRIRLGSLDPAVITPEFAEYVKKTKSICNQFHLSMQSGSSSVLQRMNRKYSAEQFAQKAQILSETDCAITTDVIAGFPGETQTEHNQTMEFIERIGFSKIHVFPFSRRKGTQAYDMPGQLTQAVKEKRASELIELGLNLERRFIDSRLQKTCEVLIERYEEGYSYGYSREYLNFAVDGRFECGQVIPVMAQKRDNQLVCGCFVG